MRIGSKVMDIETREIGILVDIKDSRLTDFPYVVRFSDGEEISFERADLKPIN